MAMNPSDLTPPRSHVGRYRLIARLGAGGMADVYLGLASGMVGFTKLSVVKVLKPEHVHDEEHVAMFLDEARLAARLNHQNVVQTNEVGEDQGLYYLVMEYLEGQTLRRVLQAGQDDPERKLLPAFLRVLCDMLAGLHSAHELRDYDGRPLNVVHRDVSPHNVFVTYDGQTKVVDFGIAKVANASHLTRTGMLKGKIPYMAPEQARSRSVDRRADIFSTGVILWEMLSGKRMWEDETDFGILQRLAMGELPSIRAHAPSAPEELLRICERSVAMDPNARFSTAQEMRDELETYMHSVGWRVTTSDLGRLMSERFHEYRTAIQGVIESAMAVGSGAHALPWLVNPSGMHEQQQLTHPSLLRQSSPSSRFRSADSASLVGNFHLSTGTTRPPPRKRSMALWLVPGLASAVLSAGGVFWLLRSRSHNVPTPVATAAVSATTSTGPTAPVAPPQAELQIRVTPASATIYLDDKELKGNPFKGIFPRDSMHELRVEAPGYQVVTQSVALQRDVSIELTLTRQPTARPVALPPPPVARPRVPTRPASQPQTPTDSPPADLPPPPTKRPVQPIDPESPY